MSFSYAYNPKVANPSLRNDIPQMRSSTKQTPFFFGGSQVPTDLFLAKSVYNGSSGSGFHRGVPSLKLPTDLDVIHRTKDHSVFTRKGHNIKLPHSLPHMK
jgi:hypothetical protein